MVELVKVPRHPLPKPRLLKFSGNWEVYSIKWAKGLARYAGYDAVVSAYLPKRIEDMTEGREVLNTTSYYIAHNRRRVSFAVRQWLNTFSTDEITDANVGKYLL